MNVEFEWDRHNTRHIVEDYPERENTPSEVESIFADPKFIGGFNRVDERTGEPRYWGMGVGTQRILKYVVYIIKNNKIRPITCWTVTKPSQRRLYDNQNDAT